MGIGLRHELSTASALGPARASSEGGDPSRKWEWIVQNSGDLPGDLDRDHLKCTELSPSSLKAEEGTRGSAQVGSGEDLKGREIKPARLMENAA